MAKKVSRLAKNARKNKSSNKRKKNNKGKTKSKYNAKRFVGLDKKFFSKVKQEFHDIDYADQLNEKQKQFLSTFIEETLGANFTHKNKKIYKAKRDRKRIYSENNARNRDVFSVGQATGGNIDLSLVFADMEKRQGDAYISDIDSPELGRAELEIMSKREFLQVLKNGAIIPDSLMLFYKKLYNIN